MCDKGKSSTLSRQIYHTFATLPLFSWKTQQKAHLGACHFTKLYHLPLPTQQKHVANLVANKTQDVVVDNAQATTKNEKIFCNFSLQRQQKKPCKTARLWVERSTWLRPLPSCRLWLGACRFLRQGLWVPRCAFRCEFPIEWGMWGLHATKWLRQAHPILASLEQ